MNNPDSSVISLKSDRYYKKDLFCDGLPGL